MINYIFNKKLLIGIIGIIITIPIVYAALDPNAKSTGGYTINSGVSKMVYKNDNNSNACVKLTSNSVNRFIPTNKDSGWNTVINDAKRPSGLTKGACNGIETLTLNNILTKTVNNLSFFKNSSFYSYSYDGGSNSINDGGGDMYDNGNLLTVGSATDISFNAFNDASSGVKYGRTNRTHPDVLYGIIPENFGNLLIYERGGYGADGNGYYGTRNIIGSYNGIYYSAWMSSVWGNSDPSINNLLIVFSELSYPSLTLQVNNNTDNMNPRWTIGNSSKKMIFVEMLLSSSPSSRVSATEMEQIIKNYIDKVIK